MPNVGFCGGSEVRDLGSASDMKVFFNGVDLACSRLALDADSGLLIDRLYRRYLRLEELAPTATLVGRVREILATIPSKAIEWKTMGWNPDCTRLDPSLPTMADVLGRHLKGVEDLIRNAESFNTRFKTYQPVMTIVSDLPRFVTDETRPLADYDALEGDPIWLR